MTTPYLAAALQTIAGADVADNLREAGALITQAAAAGAKLILLPENFAHMGREPERLALAETDGSGPIQDFLSTAAMQHGVYLVGGSLPLRSDDRQRAIPALLLYGPDGERLARYDKIHLFDVDVPGTDERYRESATWQPGPPQAQVVDTPLGRIGLAICYDLRFPELFRAMATQDVDIVLLPAAFTANTGEAHWEVLLRARAIENLCYVLAANQGGSHPRGRETWGDSMLVDPWGNVQQRLARGQSGVVLGRIDLAGLQETRRHFPALEHRRIQDIT